MADVIAGLDEAFAPLATADTVWTVGHIEVHPNASSVVPGRAEFTVQWRDASAARLAEMDAALREMLAQIAAERDVRIEVSDGWSLAPAAMNKGLVSALSDAAEACAPGGWRRMPSGALHDATNVSRVLPTAMLFVPSIGGISHDFAEDTREEDLVAGLQVLARAALGTSRQQT
jgi:N-carbamoyl-L-amino-acid hydrolase